MSQSAKRLGFLGGGNMAEAIIRGVLDAGVLQASQVFATDISPERRDYLRSNFPISVVESNSELMAEAGTILFAVKPQNIDDVLREVAPAARADHLFFSICAGLPTTLFEQGLQTEENSSPRVVRIMPNTPSLVGKGMAGICKGTHASDDDVEFASQILGAVGEVVTVPESQMDAVTALTGSGPAYVFYMIESLVEAAQHHGFSEEDATKMILQMVRGAAELAHGSSVPPARLRKNVTSPGGTTAAGLAVLEDRQFRETIAACVNAAEKRGKELAEGKG